MDMHGYVCECACVRECVCVCVYDRERFFFHKEAAIPTTNKKQTNHKTIRTQKHYQYVLIIQPKNKTKKH